jgi:hypothetical protein
MAREEITTERRRRNSDGLQGFRGRLSLNDEHLDTENFTYRWVNDNGTRIYDLTQRDDWEVVVDREGKLKTDGAGMGAETSVPVGLGEQGKALKAVLLRKPKKYHEDDERAKQSRIDALEASLKTGAVPGQEAGGRAYVPQGGITFDHGSRK